MHARRFLARDGDEQGTFFPRYRHNPAYTALLDIRADRMHRLWIRRDAVAVIRAARVCDECGFEGHPRHTWCRGCDTPFPRPS